MDAATEDDQAEYSSARRELSAASVTLKGSRMVVDRRTGWPSGDVVVGVVVGASPENGSGVGQDQVDMMVKVTTPVGAVDVTVDVKVTTGGVNDGVPTRYQVPSGSRENVRHSSRGRG